MEAFRKTKKTEQKSNKKAKQKNKKKQANLTPDCRALSPSTELRSKAVISQIGYLSKTSVDSMICATVHMRMLRIFHRTLVEYKAIYRGQEF